MLDIPPCDFVQTCISDLCCVSPLYSLSRARTELVLQDPAVCSDSQNKDLVINHRRTPTPTHTDTDTASFHVLKC